MSPAAAGALTALLVAAVAGAALEAHARRATTAARSRVSTLAPAVGGAGLRPSASTAVPASLARLADDLAPAGSADALVHRWLVAVVVGPAAALLVGGPALALPAAVAVVAGPVVAARVQRARRPARADRLLPTFLDAVARAVRSGASLRHALRDAADAVVGTALAPEAAALARALAEGVPLADALAAFGGPGPSPIRRLTVDALGLADEVGGAPAALIDRVADTARERAGVAREARALAAQARASAVVIVVAPAAFAVLGAATDPRIAAFVTTPAGVACVAAGLACDAAGAWWMSRLVGRSA